MKQHTRTPSQGPIVPPSPVADPGQVLQGQKREKAEPVEVLGRHKNSGQKDHKGAR